MTHRSGTASPILERAAQLSAEYLESLDSVKVSATPDIDALRARLTKPLTAEGQPGLRVLDELAEDVREGLLHTASGRFFGWVIGGGLPVSVAADWLTSVWDQNAAASACSPSAAIIEEVAGEWLKQLFGLPSQSSYAFVTGCQMAHVTAMAAARHKLLADKGWSVEEQGLAGAPAIRVIVGEHHETLLRALRLVGIGTAAVIQVAQNDDGTMDPSALGRELADDPDAPTIVSLAAGDLNRGAFDAFGEICDVAHPYGAWVHVDGAFGLWAAASETLKPLVRGIERADSWATDAHKWLNVPYDSGIVFVAHPEAHTVSMTVPAAYKVDVGEMRDQFEWGPEWSRRARGIPIYAALRTLGREGLARMIDACCEHARTLVDELAALPGVELLARPIVNQGLVRFIAADGDHDGWTEEVIRRVNESGEAWFGPTTWNDMRVMRISVSNHRTGRQDIERTVAAFRKILGSTGVS